MLPGLGGMVISQAMCFGLPVICTHADGSEKDLVQDGRNGFFLEKSDPHTLSVTIRKFIEDERLVRDMGRASREIVSSEITFRGMLSAIVNAGI